MKRYLTFYGAAYYPSGGMDDFIGDFDTKEEAIECIKTKKRMVVILTTAGQMFMTRKIELKYTRSNFYCG